MMIAAVGALGGRRPAKLGAEDHEGVVEEPAGLEVGKEGGDRLVDLLCVGGVVVAEIAVGVPVVARVAEVDLHKPHPCLEAASREHALSGIFIGRLDANAVAGERAGGLPLDLEHPRRLRLHPPGHLERLDPGLEPRVAPRQSRVATVASGEEIERWMRLPLKSEPGTTPYCHLPVVLDFAGFSLSLAATPTL